MKIQKLNQRQVCWALYLSRFDFTLKHVLGTEMEKADGLSRQLNQKVEVENDNNQVFIKDCCLHNVYEVVIDELEVDIVEKIKKTRSKNKKVVRVVEEIKKARVKALKGEEWQIEGDLVLKESKVYMLKDKELRIEIIQLHHDVLVVGHKEKQKMMKLVTRNYWQPRVTKDIGKYIEGHNVCQRMKNRMEVSMEKLKLSKILEKLQTYLTVDFVTKLLLVAKKDTILVVCNILSKMTYFVVTIEGILAKELVRLFRDNVWKLHELPESIVLDRGPQFVAKMTKELNAMLGIETKLLTAFHLQIDSQIERTNQELKQYLRFFVDYRQKDWPKWLVSAEFAINNKAHSTTKISSFIANYRRELKIGIDLKRKRKMKKIIEFVERMRKVQKEAGAVLVRVQKEIKRQVNRERKKVKVQKVEDKVILSTKDLVFKE